MLNFLFSLSSCENAYLSLTKDIVQTRRCGKANEQIDFFAPLKNKFLFVINAIDNDIDMDVHSPTTGEAQKLSPKAVNSLYFPDGNGKVTFNFKKDGACVNVASAGIPICASGISVVTKTGFSKKFNVSRNADFCIFYAPASNDTSYDISTNIGDDHIYVYNSVFDNVFTNDFHGEYKYTSTGTNNAWLFRYMSGPSEKDFNDSEEKGFKIYFKVNGIDPNALSNDGQPSSFAATTSGVSKNAFFPIFGSICPIILLVSWIFTFIHLYRKSPVEGVITMKNDNS